MTIRKFGSAIRVGYIQWAFLQRLSQKTGIPAASLLRMSVEHFKTSQLGKLIREDEL